MKKLALLSLLIISIFTACRKEVDYKFIEEKPQLVVQSFFTPAEDTIRVYLSYTESFFEDKLIRNSLVANLSKAQLNISDGSLSKSLKWSTKERAFVLATTDLPLIAGKTYSLNVKTFEGLMVSANSKMPKEITGAQLTNSKGLVKNQQRKDRITMSVNSETNVTNYLDFRLFIKSTFTYIGYVSEQLQLIDQSLLKENTLAPTVSSTFNKETYLSSGGTGSSTPNPNYKVVYHGLFIKANEEYYKYLDVSQKNNNASDNPFAEPTTLYTNITGGLGIFAAYQLVIKEIPYE